MKPLPLTELVFLTTLTISGLSATARERHLSYETLPIDTAKIMESAVWDFSKAPIVTSESRMMVELHGDTLVNETRPGLQEWFSMSGKSLFYIGMETLTRLVASDSPLAVLDFPLSYKSCQAQSFLGEGRVYSRYPYSEAGYVESSVGTTGHLITPDCDTLMNVTVTRLTREVSVGVNMSAASLVTQPSDSMPRHHAVTYRWYAPDDCLPLAMMTFSSTPNGYSDSGAFIIDSAKEPVPPACRTQGEPVDTDGILRAIADATVTFDGGNITIGILLPEETGLTLRTDIVDIPGNLYLSRTHNNCAGNIKITLPVTGLPAGDYMLVLAYPAVVGAVEKRPIQIR